MNLWEALKALENPYTKIRQTTWEEGLFIYKDIDGNYLTNDGRAAYDTIKINDNDVWEIYDTRQDAELAWRMLYKKVMEAESYIGAYLIDSYECNKCECHNCKYSKACDYFYDLHGVLEELNKTIKLDVKHEFED